MSTIESRLAAVEQQLRLHRAVIAGLLLALVALVGIGATEGVPEEIRARKVVVVHENGRKAVEIMSSETGGRLEINDKNGTTVVMTGAANVSNGGGFLQVSAKEGLGGLFIADTRLAISNQHDDVVILAGESDEGGFLSIYSNVGEKRGRIAIGGRKLIASNEHGKDTFIADADVDGNGQLSVMNKTGKTIAGIGSDDFGHGTMQVCHRAENKCKNFQYAP